MGGIVGGGGKGGSASGTSSNDIRALGNDQLNLSRQVAQEVAALNRLPFTGAQGRALDMAAENYGKLAREADLFLNNVDDDLRDPVSFAGIPGYSFGVNTSGLRNPYQGLTPLLNNQSLARNAQAVEDATFGLYERRLDPRFAQESRDLEVNLANRGIPLGAEAWQTAMDQFGRTKNDAYMNAADQAVLAGRQEQSRLFGVDSARRSQLFNENITGRGQLFNERLSNANLRNQARSSAVNERLAERNATLAQIGTYLGLPSQAGSIPTFQNVPQISYQAPDIMGAIIASQQAAAQRGSNTKSGMLGALGDIGAAASYAAIASDRRLKRDIRRIGTLASGLGVYLYRYVWSDIEHVGLMADEVRKVRPSAVIRIAAGPLRGYDAVNYRAALA